MTQIYEYAGVSIILFWMFFRALHPFISNRVALSLSGFFVGMVAVFVSEVIFLVVAAFAPFGALLPTLALQNVSKKFQEHPSSTYPTRELIVVLIIYVAFLAASLGVFSFDPYRYGYSPLIGSVVAISSCGYALWRGYYFIAGALVVGQIAWSLDVGSSNYFDHMTHVIVIPLIAAVLIRNIAFAAKLRTAHV